MSAALVLDIGTHSVRAAWLDSGRIEALATRKITLTRKSNACVEQSPEEILAAVKACLKEIASSVQEPVEMAIACQRSSVLAWSTETGAALSSVLSWQDTRAKSVLNGFTSAQTAIVEHKTGLKLSPHYGASKIAYLQRKVTQQDCILGPLSSWICRQLLLNELSLCDESMAARTLLWNSLSRDWDTELASIFQVDISRLPQLCPVRFDFGELNWRDLGFSKPVKLAAVLGDQGAAYHYVRHKFSKRATLINLGTGAFVLAQDKQLKHEHSKLLDTLVSSDYSSCLFAVEGTVNGASAAISHYLAGQSELSEKIFFSELERQKDIWDNSLVYMNDIGGLGSPWWSQLSAVYSQKFVSVNDGQFELAKSNGFCPQQALALIESIVFMLKRNIEQMGIVDEICVSGGLSRSEILVERLATLLRQPLKIIKEKELTVLGAAAFLTCELGDEKGQGNATDQEDLYCWQYPVSDKYNLMNERYLYWLSLMEKNIVRVSDAVGGET